MVRVWRAVGLIVLVLSSLIFLWLAKDIHLNANDVMALDHLGFKLVSALSDPIWLTVMSVVTETGSVWWFAFFSLIIAGILWRLHYSRWHIACFLLTVAGGGVLNKLLKLFFERERPNLLSQYDGVGYSFPSGHAMGSFIFYGFLAYLVSTSPIPRWAKLSLSFVLLSIILLIGFSRVYLGVHYLTDILAGYTAGFIWLCCCLGTLQLKFKASSANRGVVS